MFTQNKKTVEKLEVTEVAAEQPKPAYPQYRNFTGVVEDTATSLVGGYHTGTGSFYHIRVRWLDDGKCTVLGLLPGEYVYAPFAKKGDRITYTQTKTRVDGPWVHYDFVIDYEQTAPAQS